MKKVISTLLIILLLFTMMPFTEINSFAAIGDIGVSNNLKYTVWSEKEKTCRITGYVGENTRVTIPSYLDGYKVQGITNYAFRDCTSLTDIMICNGVERIGIQAFLGCTSLENISIPNSVTDIGDNAFFNTAYYKKESNWESGVLYIGNHLIEAKNTISGAYSIKQGTKTIANDAFYKSTSLTSITIPNSVTSISSRAFSHCTSLTSITIPNSVTSIGEDAFSHCTSLTSITIPNSVTSIGEDAFSQCTSLTSITIPNSVTSIGAGAFYDCTALTSVTIPDSVTSIDGSSFCGCTSLENVIIGNGVTSIGGAAFSRCTSLANITIPDTVTEIGSSAFYNTAYYNDESNWKSDVLYIGNHLIEAKNTISGAYSIKQGTKTIANDAFYESTSLTSITIPDSVTSIGEYAFYRCTSFTGIIIPGGVKEIGKCAFLDCSLLENIKIGNGLSGIGEFAFKRTAYYNTESNWENGVLYIGKNLIEAKTTISNEYEIKGGTVCIADKAFYDHPLLAYIIIPNSVRAIGKETFVGCVSLSSLTIPKSVTSIGSRAFYDCTSLKSIIIPDNVINIGDKAFGYFYNNGGYSHIENFIVYGHRNSAAEIYANQNEFDFIEIKDLLSISIAMQPSKKTYYIGDSFDISGLQLKLTYSDGSTETISSGYTVSGFSSTTAGTKTVTVSYEGLTTTFNVTVNTPNISLSQTSKTMTVGDKATLTATTTPNGQTVTWTSSNSSVASVSNGIITAKASGTATITAKFTYNGKTYSKTCNVTVNNPPATVSSIVVQSKPSKTVYTVGETFSSSGLSVKVNMSDGTSKTITTGFTVSSPDMSTAGTKTVTVTYQGKTTTFTITVNNPPATVSSISVQSKPSKTVYTVGETFNSSGLSIKVNMSDGTSKTVTSGFTLSSPDMKTAGTKTITVTYQGKTTTFNITINKPINPTAAQYKISGAKTTAGSTVEVFVSIENNPGIISLRNKIAYNTAAMELVKVEDQKLLSGYTTPSPTVNSPYTLRWADSLATQNNTANGNIVKLTFKIKDDAQAGDYNISVLHVESRTATGEKIEFTDSSAVITVMDYILGDVDGNGEVDDWDAIVLNRYLAGWQTEANLAAADIDGDGELTDWDAIALERRLAGWDV